MKHQKQISIILLVLLSFMGVSAISLEREVYVSLVPKNTVSKFHLRLATPTAQLVATRAPVEGALQSFRVKLSPKQRLYIVEFKTLAASEKFHGNCFERFCVLVTEGSSHQHLAGELFRFEVPEEVTTTTTELTTVVSDVNIANDLVDTVSSEYLQEVNARLSGALALPDGSFIKERSTEANKKLTRDFLRSEYEKSGLSVTEVKFSARSRQGINLVAEKKGREDGFVIVSAHYDSVNSSPGADDDASGLATALALAKSLQGKEPRYTIRFVAFDLEEIGLLGSAAYARHLKDVGDMNNLHGVFQVEMAGYNPKGSGSIHIIDCNENTSAELTSLIEKSIQSQGLHLKKVDACTDRSDHAVFWTYNKPAIVISENFFGGEGNPCYHRQCDKIDKLDYTYMRDIAQSLLGLFLGW